MRGEFVNVSLPVNLHDGTAGKLQCIGRCQLKRRCTYFGQAMSGQICRVNSSIFFYFQDKASGLLGPVSNWGRGVMPKLATAQEPRVAQRRRGGVGNIYFQYCRGWGRRYSICACNCIVFVFAKEKVSCVFGGGEDDK